VRVRSGDGATGETVSSVSVPTRAVPVPPLREGSSGPSHVSSVTEGTPGRCEIERPAPMGSPRLSGPREHGRSGCGDSPPHQGESA
jgi:hypothetical protein